MKRVLLFLVVAALLPSVVSATGYYVTQDGSGDGSTYEKAMSISAHNSRSFSSGDVIYLCGLINSPRVIPPSSGTDGNRIIYSGDCPGHPGHIKRGSGAVNVFGMYISGKSHITVQDLEISDASSGIWANEESHHITVKRCRIHDMTGRGVAFVSLSTQWGGSGIGCNNIIIGGAPGDGNEMYDIGMNTAGGDVDLGNSHDIVVSYNHLYATKSGISEAEDRGIDGVVTEGVSDLLIEYNEIHDHNDAFGSDARGEDGIDLKLNSNNVVIRYNHIYNHRYQTGITVQMGSNNVQIYGNRIHDNHGGVCCWDNNDDRPPVNNVRIWDNIIYSNDNSGIYVSSWSGHPPNNIKVYNNVLAENGIDPELSHEAGLDIYAGSDFEIKNNVFYKNEGYGNPYRQIYVNSGQTGSTVMENNVFHWPGHDSKVYWGSSGDVSPSSVGSGNTEDNPYFADADNNNYRLLDSSPCVGTGQNLGVDYNDLLHPSTNWEIAPPYVVTMQQGAEWNKGAYGSASDEQASLLFKTGFESPVTVSSDWSGNECSNAAYKAISGADQGFDVFSDLPFGHNKIETLCCDSSYCPFGMDDTHVIDIENIPGPHQGALTKALHLKGITHRYSSSHGSNRDIVRTTEITDSSWNEFHQKFYIRFSAETIDKIKNSNNPWMELHAIFIGGGPWFHSPYLTSYVAQGQSEKKVYLSLGVPNDNYYGAGNAIDYNSYSAVAGTKDPNSGQIRFAHRQAAGQEKEIEGDTWYRIGIYYKLGRGSGGEIKITQDGETIIHGAGDTAGRYANLYNVRFISDYGNSDIWPKEMWIDDLEFYDTWIVDEDCLPPDECCPAGEVCQGGVFRSSSDCGDLCCVGGVCQQLPQTCESQNYNCCDECQSGHYAWLDSTCPGSQSCCGECFTEPYERMEVEAESGTLSPPMTTGTDSQASGGTYIYSSEVDEGSVSFIFDVQKAANYRLEGRVMTPEPKAGHDSFFIGLGNQGSQGDYDYIWDTLQTDTFAWDNVSLRGPGGDYLFAEFDPKIWELSPGAHTFKFFGREYDTRLDKVALVRHSHRADRNPWNICIDMTELTAFIDSWKYDSTAYPMWEMMEAVVIYYSPGDWC